MQRDVWSHLKRRAPAVLVGMALALVVSIMPGSAQETPSTEPLIDARGTPPLLVSSRVDVVDLAFSTTCAMPDIEQPCDLATWIHYRPAQGGWSTVSQLAAGLGVSFRLPVPDAAYVDYYLEVTERQTGAKILFPEGGAESPLRYYVAAPGEEQELAALPVGQGRAPDSSFRLLWGAAPG